MKYALLFALIALPRCATSDLERYFARRQSVRPFSGSVRVMQHGKTIFARSYGDADVEQHAPNRNDTIYRIGSLTKPIVSAAALKQLTLSDAICRHFSPCPAGWEGVTVAHLLSHTSGIPDRFGDVPSGPGPELVPVLDRYLATQPDVRPKTTPGETYRYSNFGYLLLAYVMEKAAGRPWLDLIRDSVLIPASMPDTRYDDVWAIVPRRARGYDLRQGALRNIAYKDDGAFSAGGFLSTTADLGAFATALFDRSLLPAELTKSMLTPVRADYGYGWQITRHFDRAVYNHRGGTNGFASFLVHYPDSDLTIIVLSNVESEPVRATACDLASLLFGLAYPRLDEKPASASDLSPFTGTYVSEDGSKRVLAAVDGALHYQRGETDAVLERAGSNTWRFAAEPDILLRVEEKKLTAVQCGRELFAASR